MNAAKEDGVEEYTLIGVSTFADIETFVLEPVMWWKFASIVPRYPQGDSPYAENRQSNGLAYEQNRWPFYASWTARQLDTQVTRDRPVRAAELFILEIDKPGYVVDGWLIEVIGVSYDKSIQLFRQQMTEHWAKHNAADPHKYVPVSNVRFGSGEGDTGRTLLWNEPQIPAAFRQPTDPYPLIFVLYDNPIDSTDGVLTGSWISVEILDRYNEGR